ncbi:MAG: TonB-dependent receptor [Pseudomonadota bacterium]
MKLIGSAKGAFCKQSLRATSALSALAAPFILSVVPISTAHSQNIDGSSNAAGPGAELQSAERAYEDVIVVRSTRSERPLEDLSRSARVFSEEDLLRFNQQTTSLQEILGKTIPGFAPPVTEGSAASLTLRGRDPLFLIDGVPIASNTNFTRFLDKFDPLTIGRTEVVYGPTALYGAGATGGVIQFFTKDPAEEGLEFSVGSQFRVYATGDDSFSRDGFSPKANASVSGKLTDWLSVFAYVSYEDINGVYSADDDLLSGRSAFANDTTYFGKVRIDLTDSQSLTAIVNRTELESADRQFELRGELNDEGAVIAVESPTVFSYAQPPTNEFLYTALAYQHKDLVGGAFDALFYYSDSEFLNPGSDIRDSRLPEWPGLWQSGRINEEYGVRGQYVRDFGERLNLSLGFDYNTVDSTSLLPISTEEGFDDTLFFDAAVTAIQNPPFTLDAVGVFLESSYDLTDQLTLTGGVRWDRFDYEVVGPYDVVFTFPPLVLPGERPGGEGSADGVSYNIGATYDVRNDLTLFANFSQGFAIPSLGFIGNNVDPGVPVSDSSLVDPVITDSYEAGVRGQFGDFTYALAGYYTTSDFLTTVSVSSDTGLNNRTRAPVRIYGTEFSSSWKVTEQFDIEGSITHVVGEVDPNDSDDFIAISTQDVPPLKLSLNPSYEITPEWSVFGQWFYVADREAGFNAGTDPRAVQSYSLFDIGTTYQLDIAGRGAGVFNFQITNLFNEDYIPAGEVTFIPGRIRPGPGRAISLSYQHTF